MRRFHPGHRRGALSARRPLSAVPRSERAGPGARGAVRRPGRGPHRGASRTGPRSIRRAPPPSAASSSATSRARSPRSRRRSTRSEFPRRGRIRTTAIATGLRTPSTRS
jgi:hypothetical protein